MIPVTKPYMPPREEYEQYLQGIWDREYLTNNGPLVQQLEQKLKDYLDVEHLLYLTNGTIALQIAIKALGLKGEIITTPFSYVATTSSIVWEGCTPVFVDIDPQTLNINPTLIEEAISDKTTGILATHVFGNPCDIEAIQSIADKHDLKVIYDAAHCFGTTYKNQSVFEFGDVSTSSFHATKLFHTVEGGAVFTKDEEINYRMSRMRNFGHAGFKEFDGVGINGKNSEFHAAMGLCNLAYIEKILASRKRQCLLYEKLLKEVLVRSISIQKDTGWNYAYYPVIFESEAITLRLKEALEQNDIYPRRYFYPSLDTLEYVKTEKVKVSKDISERILCLPVYFSLEIESIEEIVRIISKEL
ncbi:DegT/DnrJ/EryC1/StrS family aminotransferase [Rhodohalobacter barkolensis]|uniref:Aminotransferase DegT n=1 Tax=Rhodohalobacter barkolensis TaxID=2053187 RepID=A0A2N0VKD9_9BACT|nr:DegT/DnrJ/EryC1/StrS family aminotransferase [Rhodohalobacter barkolensis]PKD44656.1 aminotransferase DegT [Rhodohalobacter barkolensis]